MARRKAEIDLLGVASKEELMKFEVAKEVDKPLADTVSKMNNTTANKSLVTEEEILRIKKKGEQEILDIQNELKEFKLIEERKISFLPLEEDDEEEIYIPTKLERVLNVLKSPFIRTVDKYDNLSFPEKFEYLKSVILVLLVLISVSLAVFGAKKYKIDTASYIDLNLYEITAGHQATPKKEIKIKEDTFVLSLVMIDGQNTLFLFDGPVDFVSKYSASIEDNELNKYYMDLHYMRNPKATNQGKVLAIEALHDGIKEFDLIIKENATGETFKYHFRLKEFLKKSDYVSLYNMDNVNSTGLNLDSYITSASGSVLYYSLAYEGENFTYKAINDEGTYSDIFQSKTVIPSKQNRIEQYDFPEHGISLLQEAFVTPRDVGGEIEFRANNIFKSYAVGKTLSRGAIQNGLKLDYDNYSLHIEGIQKKGDMAVLVYHVEDNSFVPPAPVVEDPKKTTKKKNETEVVEEENFTITEKPTNETNRVYSLLDVEIVLFNGRGEVIDTIAPSVVKAADEGADIVFKDDRLSKVANNFGIRINNVNIRDTEYTGKIDLSEVFENSEAQQKYKADIANIEEGFQSRLSYKAAETPRSRIKYFSDSIMQDKELLANYVPVSSKSPATNSVEVIATASRGVYIYAIVEEDFIALTYNSYIHVNNTHRVIYDTTTQEIILDEIISTRMID